MKTFLVALFLTVAAAAQTTITVSRATSPLSGSPAPAASGSSSSSSSASSSPSSPAVTGDGDSFAEIPVDKKAKKKVVVPASLQGSTTGNEDAGLAKQHADASVAAAKQVGLHFDNPVDGTDSVSVAVRNFQLFCNSHNMAEDEIEVRKWVSANSNIVASSPAEMQRKQQYPLIREQLIGMKFPKEWFEPAAAAASTPSAK